MNQRRVKRKRGGQPGNCNARTHGLYAAGITPDEAAACSAALVREGTDPAVALIRLKLAAVLRDAPSDARLLRDATRLITRHYLRRNGFDKEETALFRRFVRGMVAAIAQKAQNDGTNRGSAGKTESAMPKRIEAGTPEGAPLAAAGNSILKKPVLTQRIEPGSLLFWRPRPRSRYNGLVDTAITLRPFAPDDIEPVWSLVQRTIGTSYKPEYGPDQIRFFQDYHPRHKILDDAANGMIIVAEQDEIIVGTGTIREAHIRRVFIEPACQGQGIGTVIVTELEAEAARHGWTYVDLSSALGSRTFWERHGYAVAEEVFAPVRDDLTIHYYTMAKTFQR